jgi:ubiquinone biosynthesis protein COQ4
MSTFDFLDSGAFFKFAANTELTQEAFNIQSTFIKHPRRAEMIQWSDKAALADADFMELYNRKYIPDFPSIEELGDCPAGSLGKGLAKHLLDNKIALNFAGLDTSIFYKQDVGHINYLAVRGTRCHDLYHVVTGLGTSPLDEYRLFAVQLAQFASAYHMILLASGYLHMVFEEPENIKEFLDSMSRYYEFGKRIRFLAGFPYEDHWRTDLNEVRAMLKITELDV